MSLYATALAIYNALPIGKKQFPETRSLHIPDLFAGILSGDPERNPHEVEVGRKSEAWTKELVRMDARTAKILTRANFAYLISLSAPKADEEAFRMGVDWCIWAFVFDDQFDEGAMKDKTIEAAREMIDMLATQDNTHPQVDPKEHPLQYMFQSVWQRFKARNPSPGLERRWKYTHKKCLFAILKQVDSAQRNIVLDVDIDAYMETRRHSIGSYCLFAVVEWAHAIKAPEEAMQHPSVRTCERAAADLTWLVNDVLSYKKDLAFGVEHNLIRLLMRQGHSEQDAMNLTGELMENCQRDWEEAIADLPHWDAETNNEVRRYIDACSDVARANLHWSFKSGRYLNAEQGKKVRETRIMDLP
ncbi:terpenoid synthase [Periconia macrospinosa]|uniref:Terpene synthase n=1 Tax=Periconia macrospinosa TaxID=97972 RepID=A0A2V1D3C1_9PLEO|nr:terpenoid synthase [Periconia macrospinosa]